jgi:hypothetical protein
MRLSLGDRALGPGAPALLVAEIGSNHDGSLERALALVDAAAGAGADAVQFHSLRAARLLTRARAAPTGVVAAEGHGHLERVELRTEWHATPATARARAARLLSTPFDEQRRCSPRSASRVSVAAGDLVHAASARARRLRLADPARDGARGEGRDRCGAAAIGEAPVPARRPPVVLLAGPREPDGTSDLRAIAPRSRRAMRPWPAGAIAGPVTPAVGAVARRGNRREAVQRRPAAARFRPRRRARSVGLPGDDRRRP